MPNNVNIDKELLVSLASKLNEYIELLTKMNVCDLRIFDMGIKPISMNLAISPESNHLRVYVVGQWDDLKELISDYVVEFDTLKDQIDNILDEISEEIEDEKVNPFDVLMSLLDDWYQTAKIGDVSDGRETSN